MRQRRGQLLNWPCRLGSAFREGNDGVRTEAGGLFASKGNKPTAILCQPNCWNQVGSQASLEHVTAGSRFQGGAASITIFLDGKENNSGGWLGF